TSVLTRESRQALGAWPSWDGMKPNLRGRVARTLSRVFRLEVGHPGTLHGPHVQRDRPDGADDHRDAEDGLVVEVVRPQRDDDDDDDEELGEPQPGNRPGEGRR